MKIALIVACLLAVPCAAVAQDGRIAGTVTDATGGILPGVTVVAAGPVVAGGPLVIVTDGTGQYAFAALPPGEYTLTFTLLGFEQLARAVDLASVSIATVDVSLRVGGLFEAVTVAVTGTAIDAPAINMPHAVAVVSRETMEQQGSTQLVDLFKNLSVSHGVIGERNSWYNSNQPATLTENVANVNLRGLGASRTLVLFNGRRHVPVPARLIGGRFVDVNTIPAIAVGRLEVLKEGAAATYGSDAVGGVANFVTRSDFRGFELNVSHDLLRQRRRYDRLRYLGWTDRRFPRGVLRGTGRPPGAADGGSSLDPRSAEHVRRGQPRGVVQHREPRHVCRRGPRAGDGRCLRPPVYGFRRPGRGLDLPVSLRAVRQPDRRAATDPRLW